MDGFKEALKDRLKYPLPGERSYEMMQPRAKNGLKMNFNYKTSPKPGAVLIAFYPESEKIFFPLIQRPEYDGVHSGQIGLPGGKKEEEDQDLYETALRESWEEIGLQQESVEILGSLSEFYVSASNHVILPVIGYVNNRPGFVPDHIEVEEVIEAPLAQLTDKNFHKTKDMDVRGFPLITPYFEIQGKVVWGATAMMLSELYTVIKEL